MAQIEKIKKKHGTKWQNHLIIFFCLFPSLVFQVEPVLPLSIETLHHVVSDINLF